MANIMDDPNYGKPEDVPGSSSSSDPIEPLPADVTIPVATLAHSAYTPQQMEEVFALILTGSFGDVKTLKQVLLQLEAATLEAKDVLVYKKPDLIGDASLVTQLVPGQRLIITTGVAEVGVTEAELEALAAYVDSLVDGEDETGGDAGGDA